MLQEIGDPLTVFGIGLATRNRLDVVRVHQQQLEMALQHSPDWSPVHTRRLHGDVPHLVFSKPVPQLQQIGGHGSKTAYLLPLLAIGSTADDTGINALLVHIQSSASSMNDFHSLSFRGRRRKPLWLRISFACSPSLMAATVRCASRLPGQTNLRATRHQ